MLENGQLTVLNIDDILPNRFQPRIRFDEERLDELAESIAKFGVIQPIVVRPMNDKFEIIAGERRFKASKLVNKATIPAIVINLSDKDSEEIALLENVQRQELNPIEEAVSYKRILDMGYITQEELAKKIGKSQSSIVNKIRLLTLDDEVQNYLLNNKISERHARSLLRIPNKEQQTQMLHRIVDERLTVKKTDKEIEKLKASLDAKVIEPKEVKVESKKEDIEQLFDDIEDERGGNMDIDKIMREAKDINVPAREEVKDISGLMQPKNDVQSEPIVREDAEVKPVNLENSKFINVAPEEPKIAPTTSNVQTGVTFDSMFNQPVNLDNAPLKEESANVEAQPTVVSQPSNTSIPEISNSEVTQEVVSEETKKIISSAVSNALKKYQERKNGVNTPATSNNLAENVNTPANLTSPVSSTPADVTGVPLASEVTSPQMDVPNTNIINDNALNEYAVNPPIVNAENSSSNQARFSQIVKLLRECADRIEQNGYFVNMDEMDLGNQYKVTFTINKE